MKTIHDQKESEKAYDEHVKVLDEIIKTQKEIIRLKHGSEEMWKGFAVYILLESFMFGMLIFNQNWLIPTCLITVNLAYIYYLWKYDGIWKQKYRWH